MFTLFKVLEINGRGVLPAWKAIGKKMGAKEAVKPYKKVLAAGILISVIAGGMVLLGWAWKKGYRPRKEWKKKRHDLKALLKEIFQEKIDGNINPKLHQLRELFQTHWDDLMAKKENHAFWKDWLVGLTDKDKTPSDEANNWNHGRKEKMMSDLGSVQF